MPQLPTMPIYNEVNERKSLHTDSNGPAFMHIILPMTILSPLEVDVGTRGYICSDEDMRGYTSD